MVPLVELVGADGVFSRIAKAEEGAPSATAATTTKDRKKLVSIFFTLTGELRRCWCPCARRVNDTNEAQVSPQKGFWPRMTASGRAAYRVGRGGGGELIFYVT